MSQTTITLLFLAFAIISFILEKIPLGLTATIVALGLNLTGVLDVSQTFAGYINSNVILCVGMFVVGHVTKFAKSERMLIIAIMIIVGVMSGFLSNTGTAAVLILVVCGIADESGYSRSRLLMPLVFAAALGGNLSIIGAPGNLMGVNALQEMGEPTSFFMYAPVGVPMLVAGIIYMAFIGYRFLPDTRGAQLDSVEESKNFDNVPKWKQYVSLAILIICILAMIFEDQIGIKLQVTACIAACILVLTGVVTEKEALKSIDLKVVLLFGGSLALATALDSTRHQIRKIRKDADHCHHDHRGRHVRIPFQHRNGCADGADRKLTCGKPRCRPEIHDHSNCHRMLLCIRYTDRNARQHNGRRPRRIQVQGLCRSRTSADPDFLRDLHGPAADPVPVLPVKQILSPY